MQNIDIRPLKAKMRNEIKARRRAVPQEEKERADRKILDRLVRLREYAACDTVITYVSLPIEVDTLVLIARALSDGKRVAVPRCVEGSREMEFYLITSMDQLEPQTFGVLEPVKERCEQLDDCGNSICVVPALAYDYMGYRLGYGAGYYDRFLSGYKGVMIGVVYSRDIRRRLWRGRYDVPVNLIVSERRVHSCSAK